MLTVTDMENIITTMYLLIGLTHPLQKFSVHSMHLVFCRMLCLHYMLAKGNMERSANWSVCGFANSLFQSRTTLFRSPWGKHQPASSSWHGTKPGLTNLLRWCTKGLREVSPTSLQRTQYMCPHTALVISKSEAFRKAWLSIPSTLGKSCHSLG